MRLRYLIIIVQLTCIILLSCHASSQGQQANLYTVSNVSVIKPVISLDSLLPGKLKGGIDDVKSYVSLFSEGKPVTMDSVHFSGTYLFNRDTTELSNGVYRKAKGFADYSLNGGLSVVNIPFELSTTGVKPFGDVFSNSPYQFFKANFDSEKYKTLLQKNVLEKIKPETVLQGIMSQIDKIRSQFEQSLFSDIGLVASAYSSVSGKVLVLPADISDLSFSDFSFLRTRLFSGISAEKIGDMKLRYEEILKSYGKEVGDTLSEAKQLLSSIKELESLENVYSKIIEWKEKFEENKTVKELKSHLPFTPDKFKEFIKDPSHLREVIQQHASLSGIQKLFTSITKLDLGNNAVQNGQYSVDNLINTGVNTGLQSNKTSAGFIMGRSNVVNRWLRTGLDNFVTNEYTNLTGISLGTGAASRFNQSVSLNVFNFSGSPSQRQEDILQPNYLSTAARQDVVISMHSDFKIANQHAIKIDISKSLGSFSHQQFSEEGNVSTKPLGKILGSEGRSNYAVAAGYDGQLKNTDVQLSIKKTGLGYNNPGNVFLRRGETQLQGGLHKSFAKRKIDVKYKIDYRNQHFDPTGEFRYTTFTNRLQGAYRFKRNNRIGLQWQQSSYGSRITGNAVQKGSNQLLQINGTYEIRISGKKIFNTALLTRQVMELPLPGYDKYQSRSILFTHSSTIVLNKNMLTLLLTSNRSSNKDYYFNTSFFNTQLSWNYDLSEKIKSTSSAGYYGNKGWNRQVGLSQQISLHAMKKLQVDLGVDVKKAIKIIRPELANQVYLNTSVYYSF